MVRDRHLAALLGRYVYADYCSGGLASVLLGPGSATGDAPLGLVVPQPTSFGRDGRGRVYVTSDAGLVYRLKARR